MATFKVGDRVRITTDADGIREEVAGKEAVIIGRATNPQDGDWAIAIFDAPPPPNPGPWVAWSRHLRPATPPAVSTWAADAVRKVTKPQHLEPAVPHPVRITT